MKTRSLTTLAALLAAFALVFSVGYAVKVTADENAMIRNLQKGTQLPETDKTWSLLNPGYLYPGNPQKSCSGNAVGPATKVYYFGHKRLDGFCMTREVLANSQGEASMCAKSYCPDCSVEDLTGKYEANPSVFTSSVIYAYCPAR